MANFQILIGTYNIGSEAAVNAIDVITQKRIAQYPIIRDNLTVIPEGKNKPLSIDIRGTVKGTDYTSLRTAIKELRQALEAGRQSFYLDDERYARILNSNFDYAYVTQDYCNYNARFVCELPYWLADAASSDVRGPTSGATYPITSNGDIRIPLKVILTAPVGGISDNIIFENKTSGLLFKFRGALAATEQLVIDAGYDDYNRPNYKVELEGVSAMSAFEGDFMYLEDGINNLEFTGEAATTVSLYWRDGFVS